MIFYVFNDNDSLGAFRNATMFCPVIYNAICRIYNVNLMLIFHVARCGSPSVFIVQIKASGVFCRCIATPQSQ